MHYHQSPQPHPHESGWPPWHPISHPHSPPASGHESMLIGQLMGELKAGQARTIYVLELIHTQMVANAEMLKERLPEPALPDPPPRREPLSWRDWAQIVIAALVVIGALTGRLAPKDAIGLIGKPFGF